MSIVRTKRTANFTVVNNALLEDKMLDWKDVGLLVYLLSKPDHWVISAEHLATQKDMGVKGIYTGLKAIVDAGYAVKKPNPKGGWDWEIFDECQASRKENRNAENRNAENRNAENRNAENRNAENGRLVNTEPQQELKNKQELIESKEHSPETVNAQAPVKTIKFDYKKFETPEWINREWWDKWQENRHKNKSAMTELALDGCIEDLIKINEAGLDATQAMKEAAQNQWKRIGKWYIENNRPRASTMANQLGERKPANYVPARNSSMDNESVIDSFAVNQNNFFIGE